MVLFNVYVEREGSMFKCFHALHSKFLTKIVTLEDNVETSDTKTGN